MSIRMPLQPPNLETLLQNTPVERLTSILTSPDLTSINDDYPHWDKLFHMPPPTGFSSKEWWLALKFARNQIYRDIPLLDTAGRPFKFLVPNPIHEELHKIDLSAGGHIGVPQAIIGEDTRTQYFVSSLIEEAITSSQLEGAATTRAVAKEMIREKRPATDRSEQMILNNYAAMQRITELKEVRLTKEVVFELQSILTNGTLDNPDARGRFRNAGEDIVVEDPEGTTYHVPPPSHELESRMELMCAFANGDTPGYFLHPVLRSIMLHFWLAYDHPFVDGNGRTARALFYWSMLRSGFWFCEYISISHIIRKAPVKYARTFLLTESDDNDLTYFLNYHIHVLRQALTALDKYVQKKSDELKSVDQNIRLHALLNPRQRALIAHALRHPHAVYSTNGHQTSHKVTFNTARSDVMDLVDQGFLQIVRLKRPTLFVAAKDLDSLLKS